MNPLVSIIIPTYNRAHLIGETLDSIIAQTYTHWECIVVDDGSTDDTSSLMNAYITNDKRFKYHHRPKDRLPGGNAARNYGFELSKGDFIQWFDSDDIMVPQHLEIKVTTLLENKADFVVSKSKYFNRENPHFHPYNYTTKDLHFEAFAMGAVSWITGDFMIDKVVAKKELFNEHLKSGQEYNYCCKILLHIKKPIFIDKYLTLRRWVANSIGNKRREDSLIYLQSRFDNYWLNYLDIKDKALSVNYNKYSLTVCMSAYFLGGRTFSLPQHFKTAVVNVFSWKAIYFFLAIASHKFSGRYVYFYSKIKQ